jgi:hypothetical protein
MPLLLKEVTNVPHLLSGISDKASVQNDRHKIMVLSYRGMADMPIIGNKAKMAAIVPYLQETVGIVNGS